MTTTIDSRRPAGSLVRVAYADPPYIGQARKHYSHDPRCAEVDHAALIAQIEAEYDGWALSCSESSLALILPLCPAGVRVLAWCKPFCAWKSCNPAYAWEPVIIKPPRPSNRPAVRSYHLENMTTRRGLVGVKPESFCFWLFTAMNLRGDDMLDDLYPGSGAVSRAWDTWRRQAPLSRGRSRKRPQQARMWNEATA